MSNLKIRVYRRGGNQQGVRYRVGLTITYQTTVGRGGESQSEDGVCPLLFSVCHSSDQELLKTGWFNQDATCKHTERELQM